jgi:hypothetical protein
LVEVFEMSSSARLQARLDATLRKARALDEAGHGEDAARLQNKVAGLVIRIASKDAGERSRPPDLLAPSKQFRVLQEKLAFQLMDALGGRSSQVIAMPNSSYYVQWASTRRGVHVEFSANDHLAASDKLEPMQLIELGQLGWCCPDRWSPNHWLLVKTKAECLRAAAAVVLTLQKVADQSFKDIESALTGSS